MPATAAKPITAIIQEGHGVLSIKADANVLQASKKLRYHNVGSLVVMDELGVAVGMVTERDMLNKVLAEAKDPTTTLVKDVMTNGVVSITPLTSIPAAQKIMAKHGIRHLPIIEDGLLVGMLSTRDILSYQFAAVKSLLKQQFGMNEDIDNEFPDMDG